MFMSRRAVVCTALAMAVVVALGVGDAVFAGVLDPSSATPDSTGELLWYDIRGLDIEGRGWSDTKAFYDRLPARAEGMVPGPVWNLGRQTAGMCTRFVTDATTIQVRWSLTGERLDMPHFPATGVSGVDLYVRMDDGSWRWVANGRPTEYPENTAALASGIPPGEREFLLYLPLYNGVTKVETGIPADSFIATAPPYPPSRGPIIFYGTSITQGGCASRPGMCHPAILGRWFERPVINLGFSGNGKMEQVMADLLAELDPAVYVLDCLPNMNAGMVAERVEPFVRTIRAAHPDTPILLVEDRSYQNSFIVPSSRERNRASREALTRAYMNLVNDGVEGLYYLSGDTLLGDDGEGTVDSSHPTDLGFHRQAQAFRSVLVQIFADMDMAGR